MNFLHYSLQVDSNQAVRVVLQGQAANVRLLDDYNFSRYRRGESHTYYGGHVTRSPYIIPVPSSGHWNVAIDLGGYAGRVNASVSVIG